MFRCFVILLFQTSLQFTAETDISLEARSLIVQLLVESEKRLDYAAIVEHPFFRYTDWEHLAAGVCVCVCVCDILHRVTKV